MTVLRQGVLQRDVTYPIRPGEALLVSLKTAYIEDLTLALRTLGGVEHIPSTVSEPEHLVFVRGRERAVGSDWSEINLNQRAGVLALVNDSA